MRLIFVLLSALVTVSLALGRDEFVLSEAEADFVGGLAPLKVMVDEDFRPLSYWNAGTQRYEGISPSLFRQAAQALGLRYEFVRKPELPLAQRVDLVASGDIDLLMSVSINEERLKKGLFTHTYRDTYYAAIGRKSDGLNLESAADWARYRVAVVAGTAVVTNLKKLVPDGHLQLYTGAKDPYLAVRERRADFAIQNLLVFEEDRYNEELFDLEVARVFTEWPRKYAFFFSRTPDRPRLVALLNRYLVQADTSGLQSLYEKGAETLVVKLIEQRHLQDLLLLGFGAAVLAVLLLGVAFLNYRAARHAKTRYDHLVAHLPVGVYVLRTRPDGTKRFEFASPPMAAMVGASVAEVLADYEAAGARIDPDDRAALERQNEECLASLTPFQWEGRVRTDVGLRWITIVSRPEPQPGGDVLWHGLVTDITDVRAAGEKIRTLLTEKELLLHEVHHRIKNNMSTVSGLLTLQAAALSDPEAVAALEEARNRVLAMMVLYEKLYQQEAVTGALALADYLPTLVEEVLANFPHRSAVEGECQVDDLVLDVKLVSNLALVVNELLTNAMKYAFSDRKGGRVRVEVRRTDHGFRLRVEDNGQGLPPGFDWQKSPGFGLGLVRLLAQSLKAELTCTSGPGQGTAFVLEIPLDKKA